MVVVKKVGNTLLNIAFPENSWNEVAEIDIVFGKDIIIIANSSYQSGFGDRVEQTQMISIPKHPSVNPCVLCDDVYLNMSDDMVFDIDSLMKVLPFVIEKQNHPM